MVEVFVFFFLGGGGGGGRIVVFLVSFSFLSLFFALERKIGLETFDLEGNNWQQNLKETEWK